MNQNNKSLISVIIPCYNPQTDFFKQAIESILAQSYSNWEVIIVNDGSNINSRASLEKYIKDLDDKRISIFHLDKNFGVSIAKNKGVELAKDGIITFLDSDDMHLPWFYEEINNIFSNNPNCLVLAVPELYYYLSIWEVKITNARFTITTIKNAEKALKQKILFNTPRIVLKKEVFNKIQFDPEFSIGEDTDLCLQIAGNDEFLDNFEVSQINGYLYRIYSSKSRLTHNLSLRMRSRKLLIEKYKKGQNSNISEVIKIAEDTIDEWKFSALLDDYLSTGSLISYIKNAALNFKSFKDKIKSMRALVKTIFTDKFLIGIFGIDLRFLDLVAGRKINKSANINRKFIQHINSCKDKRIEFYAERLFKRAF